MVGDICKTLQLSVKKMSGERGDVDTKSVSDWKAKLPSVCEGYLFNMDETGIFFKDDKITLFFQTGSDCAGGNVLKIKILLLCVPV